MTFQLTPVSLPLLSGLQNALDSCRIVYLHFIHREQKILVFCYRISESIHFSTLELWLTACNCNTFGSYSSQCNYTTGDCHCRPNIRGSHCDRCAKGMVGFPTCVKCDCNPIGSRFLPGLANNVCYGSAKVSVTRADRLVQSDRAFRGAFCPCVKTSSHGNLFCWHVNVNQTHMIGFARWLVLKLRHKVTRKWPIFVLVIRNDTYVTLSHMQELSRNAPRTRNAPPILLGEEHCVS